MSNKDKEYVHAPFGGSVASRRLNCTASYAAEQKIKNEVGYVPHTSEQAEDGSRAHAVNEYELARFLYHKIHGEYPDDLEKPTYYEEYKDFAKDYVELIWKNVLHETITGKQYAIEGVLVIERNLGMYGPADFCVIYADERGRWCGAVVDYKHGFDFVELKGNDQVQHYGNGLRKSAEKSGIELEYVRVAIIQPRAGCEVYREITFSAKQLDKWLAKAYKAATDIFINGKTKFKAGSWCKYCEARTRCETRIKDIGQKTKLDLIDYKTAIVPDVNLLSPQQVHNLVVHGHLLEQLVDDAKKLASKMCSVKGEWAGLKLVQGKGRKAWSDYVAEDTIAEIISDHLEPDSIYKRQLIARGSVIKKLVETGFSKEQAEELLEPYTKVSNPQVLVKSDDPRPAILRAVDLLEIAEE